MNRNLIFMRGWWILGVVWVACLGTLHPARAAGTDGFTQGNERYANGDYAGAAKAYEEQVQTGRLSANLFYNLGDTYYRLGEKGRAVLNYRRALRLEPGHGEAAANLAFVTGSKVEKGQDARRQSAWDRATWGAALSGWLGAAGLLLALASPRRRVLGLTMSAGGVALCAVGVGAIWFFSRDRGDNARAVVLAEAASALYSPVDGAKIVASLPAGGEVRILSEQGAWTYVLLADGSTRAWLASKHIERFVPR